MMIGGLTLRYLAARTLGEFYTRTLLVTLKQHVIQGLYRVVRHPGYLGILLGLGAGLATANWIVIVITVTNFIGLGYRIYLEEEMLKTASGDKYIAYMKNTWMLIPFVH